MKFSVFSFQFVDDGPGMSFGSGSDCPQASQMCCDKILFYFLVIVNVAASSANFAPGRQHFPTT